MEFAKRTDIDKKAWQYAGPSAKEDGSPQNMADIRQVLSVHGAENVLLHDDGVFTRRKTSSDAANAVLNDVE